MPWRQRTTTSLAWARRLYQTSCSSQTKASSVNQPSSVTVMPCLSRARSNQASCAVSMMSLASSHARTRSDSLSFNAIMSRLEVLLSMTGHRPRKAFKTCARSGATWGRARWNISRRRRSSKIARRLNRLVARGATYPPASWRMSRARVMVVLQAGAITHKARSDPGLVRVRRLEEIRGVASGSYSPCIGQLPPVRRR